MAKKVPGRTPHDEYVYDQDLRREGDVMREVIGDLSKANKHLLFNQARILETLIRDGDALRVYRIEVLELAQRNLQRIEAGAHCTPGCTRHTWDHEIGWKKVGE